MLGRQDLGQESEDIWWGFPSFPESPPGVAEPSSCHATPTAAAAVTLHTVPREPSTVLAAPRDLEKHAVWERGRGQHTPCGDEDALICAVR